MAPAPSFPPGSASGSTADDPSRSRLRILYVTARYLPYVGGTEIHTAELATRLAAQGHDVTVLTTDPRGASFEFRDGVRVVRVRSWPADRDYYLAPGIYRQIASGQWDLVHLQGYHTLVAPIALAAAVRHQVPFVVTFHSGGHT